MVQACFYKNLRREVNCTSPESIVAKISIHRALTPGVCATNAEFAIWDGWWRWERVPCYLICDYRGGHVRIEILCIKSGFNYNEPRFWATNQYLFGFQVLYYFQVANRKYPSFTKKQASQLYKLDVNWSGSGNLIFTMIHIWHECKIMAK